MLPFSALQPHGVQQKHYIVPALFGHNICFEVMPNLLQAVCLLIGCFSPVSGVTQSGLYCIRFGLVTADTDLEELIGMVVATGKDVEESSKVCASYIEAHFVLCCVLIIDWHFMF